MWKANIGLLAIGNDAKTSKGAKQDYATAILYLAPANEASPKTLCPYSSAGCRASCLYTAGRGAMRNVRDARVAKTLRYLNDRDQFMIDLCRDIERFRTGAIKRGLVPCVRLNGTSDIMWERERVPVCKYAPKGAPNLMSVFPNLTFYDYTKVPARYRQDRPSNYDLTFSRAEDNETEASAALQTGMRVAMVFRSRLPARMVPWQGALVPNQGTEGYQVIDGDETDLRFLDPEGCIVGLKAKGQAKTDQSGFVIDY